MQLISPSGLVSKRCCIIESEYTFGTPEGLSRRSDQLRVAALLNVIILDVLQKMKFTIPLLTLMVGFGTGWYISGKRIQENVKSVMPEGMHETFDAVAEYLGPMSKEEVNETMESIRGLSQQVVDEMNHQTFWGALVCQQLMFTLEDEGLDAMTEQANNKINNFIDQYQQGMKLGDWQKVADSMYKNITEENRSQ